MALLSLIYILSGMVSKPLLQKLNATNRIATFSIKSYGFGEVRLIVASE